MFNPETMLDAGCGRGQFVLAARNEGIEAYGFDFSKYGVGEGRVKGCKSEWLKLHDATQPWPFESRSFDLVIALDFYEHLYLDALPFVIDEMYRVAKKWVFLQIAIVGGGSGYTRHEKGYILKRGQPIPLELEEYAVAGHVTIVDEAQWYEWLDRENWLPRRDMVQWFCLLVDPDIIKNWLQNAIIVMARVQ
jgi:SAM-dependent methyltransferase